MTMKYSVGDEVRITESVDTLAGPRLTIPREEAARVAGKVGSVTQVSGRSDLPYRVDVPGIGWWWFRELDLSPANETTGEETAPEPDAPDPVAELAAFKARVVEVATQYATEYNMCPVIDDALAELGLTRPRARYTFTVTVDIPERTSGRLDTLRSDVHRVLQGLIETDGDWDGVRIVRPDNDRYSPAVQATLVE